jgi:acetyl esterase/lipase
VVDVRAEELSLEVPTAYLHIIDLSATGRLLKPEDDSQAVLYFHGGGYAAPMRVEQLQMAILIASKSKSRHVVVLEYSLTPEVPYPGQLVQAKAALTNMMECNALNFCPSRITIAGDSAGGHQALSLLAHIAQSSPYAAPMKLQRPLRAVVLISPWCSTIYTTPSYTTNAATDYLNRAMMEWFTKMWAPKSDDIWADLIHGKAQPDFWQIAMNSTEALSDKTLLLAGSDEVFLDDITMFASLLGANKKDSRVEYIKCENEAHVGVALDLAMGINGGDMRTAIETFAAALIRERVQ